LREKPELPWKIRMDEQDIGHRAMMCRED